MHSACSVVAVVQIPCLTLSTLSPPPLPDAVCRSQPSLKHLPCLSTDPPSLDRALGLDIVGHHVGHKLSERVQGAAEVTAGQLQGVRLHRRVVTVE